MHALRHALSLVRTCNKPDKIDCRAMKTSTKHAESWNRMRGLHTVVVQYPVLICITFAHPVRRQVVGSRVLYLASSVPRADVRKRALSGRLYKGTN